MSHPLYSHRMMISLGRSTASNERFPALVHHAVEGGYWAEVPAIPGCATQAESLLQLKKDLHEAIAGRLDANDHRSVLKARPKNADKRTYSSAEIRARLDLTRRR